MDFESIDWEEMWRQDHARSPWKAETSSKEHWDRRAARFNKGVIPQDEAPKGNKTGYILQMLERIRVRPDWTVLDIGCGPGTLAIPLAYKAKGVTGLDVSSEMLTYLRQNAEQCGLSNVQCVNARWQDALSGDQLEAHDVVIASRSLIGAEIKDALRTIDGLARHAVYITLPVMPQSFDWEVYEAIGRPVKRHPRYIYVLNMLYQMDIRANLELLQCRSELEFASVEDVIERMSWRTDPFSDEELLKLRSFLADIFASQPGPPFLREGRSTWALIWWEKGEER